MSIQPPQGILTIPNATLRVGRLQVDEVKGFDTVLNTFDKNTILEEDSEEYDDDKKWGLKMPNIFVATFEIKGAGSSFNFRNTSMGDAGVGYTLTFSGTTLTLKYDDSDPVLATATIPNLDFTYGKVYLTYEKQYFTVTVDGTRVLSYKDTGTRTFPDGEYINFFAGTGTPRFQNLKVVAGHLISDGTSNVSLYGGLAVTSNLEVGQANLFVDTTTSRVGVGTTTPEATLHVSGNAYVSSNLEVGSSNLFVDTVSGRVGVGTDTPKESLDVVGNMHLTRVSNVSQIKVDSNVVTEYTGPHDRPLRKYPEVALTANDNSSTSGYVADQTAFSGNADGYAYRLFDHSLSTAYQSGGSQYSSGDSTGSAQTTTATDGTTHQGVAITLDLATKIRLSYAKITSHTYYGRTPVEGTFLGSNNNSTWDVIGTFSGLSTTAAGQTHMVHISDYATKSAYRYIRLVVTKIHTSAVQNGGSLLEFRELEYYGYEEGSGSLDTTLKSVYNVPATTGTQLEVYYDGQDYTQASDFAGTGGVVDKVGGDQDGTAGTSVSFDSTYKAFVFDGTANGNITSSVLPSDFIGDIQHTVSLWFKIDSSSTVTNPCLFDVHKPGAAVGHQRIDIRLQTGSSYQFHYDFWNNYTRWKSPFGSDLPKDEWIHVTATYSGGLGSGPRNVYMNGRLCELVSQATVVNTTPLAVQAGSILLLGKRPDDTSLFDGSIANFRLYSKALNAGQVQELYDYQKDYFLGSKSQVTLYKGHLGVGVTEPSGQLELAGDERIQEYPPRAMTGYETLVEGHGVFEMYSTGALYYNGSGGNLPWTVFNKITGTFNDGSSWVSEDAAGAGAGGNYNNGGSSGYGGSNRLSSNTPLGDYLVICLPYSIVLKSYSLSNLSGATGYGAADFPRDYIIYGSNDDVNWEVVDSRNDQEAGGLSPADHVSAGYLGYTNNYTVSENNKVYSKFAIVITDINAQSWYNYSNPINASYAAISEWRLFGTPGPTTLDKGSLTLGRSLDVPRVSRYDVDTETPRPEKLVLDFDTTVNSSPTDISGKGNHGAFNGNARYSPADKAFDIAGTPNGQYAPSTSAYIDVGERLPFSGNQAHTVSLWFLKNNVGSAYTLFNMWKEDTDYTTLGNGSGFMILTNGKLMFWHYGGDAVYTDPIGDTSYGSWRHVVAVYTGTNVAAQKVYVNGIEAPFSRYESGTGTQTLDITRAKMTIGQDAYRGDYYNQANTEFSGIKVYNVALEPSEIKKLYNLGRTGRSMVISDTAVGIGKVPEAQLDVRGVANFGSRVGIGTVNPGSKLDVNGSIRGAYNTNTTSYFGRSAVGYVGHDDWAGFAHIDRNGLDDYALVQNSAGRTILNCKSDQRISFSSGDVETMAVKGSDVGINDSTPSYKLDVNGSLYYSSGGLNGSDDRIKYNEEDIPNALTLISQLKPQKYEKIMERPNPYEGTWIPTDEEWENVKEDYTYGDEYGFIAQDVRAVPEFAFLVHGEETRTDTKTSAPEEYSNLTTEEQLTYTTSYTYESNTITQEEYSNLSPEEQGLYSTQYTKQIETQTPLALNYQGLFVVAIGAIKELKAKNDDLEARVTALESA
jgi:hypothetical protein